MRFTKKVLNTVVATATALSICSIQMFTEVQPLKVEAEEIYYLNGLTLNGYDYNADGKSDYITIAACDQSVSEVAIPNDVFGIPIISIDSMCFYNCSNLTSIIIPKGIAYIGDYAFLNCSSLQSINVSENNDYYSSQDGVLFDKNKTELMQYPIGNEQTEYIIPDGVTKIGGFAFSNCSNLIDIAIPNSVTNIGISTFLGTSWLNSKQLENPLVILNNILIDGRTCTDNIIIPNDVAIIADSAFMNCKNITNVKLSENVERIETLVFANCTELSNIIIPENIKFIGDGAFLDCTNLKSITIKNPKCEIYNNNSTICNGVNNNLDNYFDGTIYGYTNSTAQEYAEEYNRSFVSLTDLASNYLLKKAEIETDEFDIVDMNSDGKCNVFDYVIMKRQFAGDE